MNKQYSMLVFDLDRTLLNNNALLSKYTIDVINKCSINGLKIILATARPIRNINYILNNINCNGFICHNGAIVYVENKEIYRATINEDNAFYLLKNLINIIPKLNISVECNDIIYSNFNISNIWENTNAIIDNLSNFRKGEIEKIIIQASNLDEIKQIKPFLKSDLYVEISEGKIAMILNKNATKYKGIKQIIKYFNININNVIAFGDDVNDYEIIKNCGLGIAVDNAKQNIKAIANFICESNENEGVAKWLDKNILSKYNI